MKIGLTQISISDRVNAAKTQTSNKTDTSSVPSSLNPSPGDSSISPIDASGINKAGSDVNAQTQQGNKATSDTARKQNNPANQNVQYDKQTLSSSDQAQTPAKETDIAQTPQPRSKGFKESLIDAQMGNMIANNTGGDRGSIDSDFGHDNGDPNANVNKQPDSAPIKRTGQKQYDPSNNKVQEPAPFPITSFDKTNTMSPYKAPERDLGPAYKQKSISAPNLRFNSPRINTPRFK